MVFLNVTGDLRFLFYLLYNHWKILHKHFVFDQTSDCVQYVANHFPAVEEWGDVASRMKAGVLIVHRFRQNSLCI